METTLAETIDTSIKVLAAKGADTTIGPVAAINFTQAALNLAHVKATLGMVKFA